MKKLLVVMLALAGVARWQSAWTIRPTVTTPYVAGVPLSAKETMDFVPAEGAKAAVSRHVDDVFYRDGAGRTREEIRVAGEPTSFAIVDPVANTYTFWKEGAAETRFRKEFPRKSAAGSHPEYLDGASQRQIEGFSAMRTKSVQLPGTQPRYSVVEGWYSPELHLDVLSVVDQPGMGRATFAFHDIVLGEPDKGLFVPPSTPRELVTTPPQVVFAPAPEFSQAMRRMQISGTVLVYLHVDENGNATDVRVLKGLNPELDDKAVQAVRKYKFKPATEDGRPVVVEMNVQVNFKIF
jgi:TonB family protein